MENLLISDSAPSATTRFSTWVSANAPTVGGYVRLWAEAALSYQPLTSYAGSECRPPRNRSHKPKISAVVEGSGTACTVADLGRNC